MFFAIILIAFGAALILTALGLVSAGFWGLFWGIVFIAIGVKIINQNNDMAYKWKTYCSNWRQKVSDKIAVHQTTSTQEGPDKKRKQK